MSDAEKNIENVKANLEGEREGVGKVQEAPGTAVLTLIFLACFAVYYFANWFALSDVWYLR